MRLTARDRHVIDLVLIERFIIRCATCGEWTFARRNRFGRCRRCARERR